MVNEKQTPPDPNESLSLNFFEDPDLQARARNEDHMNLLVDAEVARTIQEHLPEDATDDERTWARENARHTKNTLYQFEANGYRFLESPQET